MSSVTPASISFGDLLSLAFSIQTFSLVVAALLTPMILIVAKIRQNRQRPREWTETETAVTRRYRAERVTLGVAALIVIVAFVFVYHVPGYLFDLVNVVEWWKYATPVFAAVLGVTAVLVVIASTGFRRPEQPVLSPARRTWASFSSRLGLIGAGLTIVVLVMTTVAAGLASSADAGGRYIYLEVTAPNASIDPVLPWFYGWSFGVPVLVCTAVLIAVTWATLHTNAARPFRRAGTVTAERIERARTATAVVRIAAAAMLLALGGAWRFIAQAGSISHLIIGDGAQAKSYETVWRYAEFALAAGWLAPAIEVAALVLLLLVVSGLRSERPRRLANEATDPVPDTAAVQ